ncbi:hypothetical protein ACN28S_61260 [Cystobacter fuscus]
MCSSSRTSWRPASPSSSGWRGALHLEHEPAPEALALYRQANQQLYISFWSLNEGPLAMINACLELAPDFPPALALHAVASARTWFMGTRNSSDNLGQTARDSIERALHRRPTWWRPTGAGDARGPGE